MKHIFIVNPAAGKSDRTAEYRKMIEAAFAPRGLSYELLVSGAPGECRTLARQAAQSGEEVRLYACGGDGTLNEVVNGVVGYGNAAVTHFPGGSGNDTIKFLTIPPLSPPSSVCWTRRRRALISSAATILMR